MLRAQAKAPTAKSQKVQKAQKTLKRVSKKQVNKIAKRTISSNSSEDARKAGVRIGKVTLSGAFPDVSANQVLPGSLDAVPFSTKDDLSNGTVVLFTYPLDFTYTCPTELIDMSNNMPRFKELNTKVFGLSTDSTFSHQAWMRQPRKEGGIEGLNFPLVSDTSGEISLTLGALLPPGIATRATFILHEGIVRHFSFNETSVGRNSEEIIRTIEAIQHTTKYGEVCAAGFTAKNKLAMKPSREALIDFAGKNLV